MSEKQMARERMTATIVNYEYMNAFDVLAALVAYFGWRCVIDAAYDAAYCLMPRGWGKSTVSVEDEEEE